MISYISKYVQGVGIEVFRGLIFSRESFDCNVEGADRVVTYRGSNLYIDWSLRSGLSA